MSYYDKANRSTMENIEPKPVKYPKVMMHRKNSLLTNLSITDTNCLSTRAIHQHSFTSPEMKPFGGLVFNYNSSPSTCFNQYISPTNQQLQRKTSFFMALEWFKLGKLLTVDANNRDKEIKMSSKSWLYWNFTSHKFLSFLP